MRYKFRGKDQRGQWHYGSLVMGWMYDENLQPFDTAYIQKNIHRAAVQVLPETVGQYTGLKDKNGNEIYEGDILKITFDQSYIDKPFYIGEVTYRADEGYPAFDLEPWIDCGMNALSWLKSESDPSVICYEVIGNIFEDGGLVDDCKKSKDD